MIYGLVYVVLDVDYSHNVVEVADNCGENDETQDCYNGDVLSDLVMVTVDKIRRYESDVLVHLCSVAKTLDVKVEVDDEVASMVDVGKNVSRALSKAH